VLALFSLRKGALGQCDPIDAFQSCLLGWAKCLSSTYFDGSNGYMRARAAPTGELFCPRCAREYNLCPCMCPRETTVAHTLARRLGYPRPRVELQSLRPSPPLHCCRARRNSSLPVRGEQRMKRKGSKGVKKRERKEKVS
jgi:hypothetical protein